MSGGSDSRRDESSSTADLTFRYLIGLSAVAMLVIASQVLVQHHLDLQATDSRTINVAGRQRMLSQRVGQLALGVQHADDLGARRRLLNELSQSADLWRRSHRGLQEGDPELGVEGDNSPAVTRLFDAIEPDFRAIDSAVQIIQEHAEVRGSTDAGGEPFVADVLEHGDAFLRAMDEIVFTYDAEAAARVAKLRQVELGLMAVALFMLLLVALFIFRPAARRIRLTFDRLVKARTEYEQLSRLDGLTGIANRRHFDEVFDREFKRSLRDGKPLSVILVDVDHFKEFNDELGHQRGDDCIRQMAAALELTARRPADLVARYGGDEFVAVLPDTDLEGAQKVAELMQSSVRGLGIKRPKPSPHSIITISLGVASTIPERSAGGPTELLGAADDALLRAKEEEQDRITSIELPSVRPPRPTTE